MNEELLIKIYMSMGMSKADATKQAQQDIQQQQGGATGTGTVLLSGPTTVSKTVGRPGMPGTVTTLEPGKSVSTDAALAMIYANDEQGKALRNQLSTALAGLGYTNLTQQQMASTWESLVKQAEAQNASGYKQTPWDLLPMMVQPNPSAGGVSVTISKQTPLGLQDQINAAWNSALGRDATWDEVTKITDLVNQQIEKNPQKTVSKGGVSTVTGFGSDEMRNFIVNQAKKQPDYKTQQNQNFTDWVKKNGGGIKFDLLQADPNFANVRQLYMAGNADEALRTLRSLNTYATAEETQAAGALANAQQSLNAYARQMGVAFDTATAAQTIADGMADENSYKDQIRELAKSYYPAWSKQIDAGQTIASIAYPYMNSMANILELNPAEVSVDNPMIKRALSGMDKDGNPTSQSIWDFEQSLRQDPRWAYTKNARSELDSVARSVLKDFGLAY